MEHKSFWHCSNYIHHFISWINHSTWTTRLHCITSINSISCTDQLFSLLKISVSVFIISPNSFALSAVKDREVRKQRHSNWVPTTLSLSGWAKININLHGRTCSNDGGGIEMTITHCWNRQLKKHFSSTYSVQIAKKWNFEHEINVKKMCFNGCSAS